MPPIGGEFPRLVALEGEIDASGKQAYVPQAVF